MPSGDDFRPDVRSVAVVANPDPTIIGLVAIQDAAERLPSVGPGHPPLPGAPAAFIQLRCVNPVKANWDATSRCGQFYGIGIANVYQLSVKCLSRGR